MKKGLFYFSIILLFSCVETEQSEIIEEPESKFFQHPQYRFGNKMIQNLFSDGHLLYVAAQDGVLYYRDHEDRNLNSLFGPWIPQGMNSSLHYFIDRNWAIAPYEMINGLAIYQKATARLIPLFRPEDFPNTPFNYLQINTEHPTYAINGDNLLFAVNSIHNPSHEIILANLDVQKDFDGRLYLDPYEQPIKTHQFLELESALNSKRISIQSIHAISNKWLVTYYNQSDMDRGILVVDNKGGIQKAEPLANLGAYHIVDFTVDQTGDYYILGIGVELWKKEFKIIKLKQGNLDDPELILNFQSLSSHKLRVMDGKMILFDKIFPIIHYIDLEELELKAINTKELGFVTYTDIIQHKDKVYLGTNNGLFYTDLDKFWEFMDQDKFLEENAVHIRDSYQDFDLKPDISLLK